MFDRLRTLLRRLFQGNPRQEAPPPVPAAPVSAMPDQFVIFLDFLGFSEATTSWDDDRMRQLVDVLERLEASKSTFSIEGEAHEDGSHRIRLTPELTTFSDHIVASYGLGDGDLHKNPALASVWMDMYLQEAQRIVSAVALEGLRIGLLVRGGISLGKLHHSGGVVIGEAMNDAYRLESRVAVYPRVAVSSRVYSKIPEGDSGQSRLRKDKDGISHLNYLSPMATQAVPAGENFQDDIREWTRSTLAMVDQNIETFEAAQQWNQLAKWAWFRNEFVELVASRYPQ